MIDCTSAHVWKKMNLFICCIVLLGQVFLTFALRILDGPPPNCTQEGLRCMVKISNCMENDWLKPKQYTPTGPKDLKVQVKVREEENGNLVPVLVASWTAEVDGSIKFMKGTEVQVLKMSVNQHLCIDYIFINKITMNKSANGWSFFLDSVVVDPGYKYVVSVYNLPKPNIEHDSYHVYSNVIVPECEDAKMKRTMVCVKTGSLWKSNITLEKSTGQAITVGFNSDKLSEEYRVFARCNKDRHYQDISKQNETFLKVTFALEKFMRTCCNFEVEIQPFFTLCHNDCTRHRKTFNICVMTPPPTTSEPTDPASIIIVIFGILGVLSTCGLACCICLRQKKQQKDPSAAKISPQDQKDQPDEPYGPRKVFIIYSLDHPLYRDIVLKLCAFLRAKCGTEVVLDLLDTAWLGTVGRMQWLDWQKQQIEKSSDKILILCSRGVQAKWRAMCGEGRVTLKEDARSPMGDMLTPALSLIIPDLLRAAAFEKYMVAYFEDVSCEDNVPAPFRMTIKYKLMKHFEELYFRIVDKEKHEPWRSNCVEGLAEDEYFNCPSGRALRDAIEAFHAHQLENHDWFEKECVDDEEEVAEADGLHPLLSDNVPVLQCVPECREGLPILVSEVEANENGRCLEVCPVINRGGEMLYAHEFHPDLRSQVCCSHPEVWNVPGIARPGVSHSVFEEQRSVSAEAALPNPPAQRENSFRPLEESAGERFPVEDEEETPISFSPPSLDAHERLRPLQQPLGPIPPSSRECVEDEYMFEMPQRDWAQEAEICQNRESSGSDQGYISRSSLQHVSTLRDDPQNPLVALSRLQEACLLNSLKPSGFPPNLPRNGEDFTLGGRGETLYPREELQNIHH